MRIRPRSVISYVRDLAAKNDSILCHLKLEMKGYRLPIFGVSLALFLFSTYIPNWLLKVTVGSVIGVFVLLAAVLYTLSIDSVLSLAVFLAAGSLFLENRKRILNRLNMSNKDLPDTETKLAPVSELDKGAPDIVEDESHPAHETPEKDEDAFQPKEDSGSDEFKAPEDSIDEKVPPSETMPANSSGAAAHHLTRAGLV